MNGALFFFSHSRAPTLFVALPGADGYRARRQRVGVFFAGLQRPVLLHERGNLSRICRLSRWSAWLDIDWRRLDHAQALRIRAIDASHWRGRGRRCLGKEEAPGRVACGG